MQAAIVGVVRTMLSEGLKGRVFGRNITPEVIAATVSCAIYGAVNAWVRDPQRASAEQMAAVIETLVGPVFAAGVHGEGATA